jgi:AcrR family transcriptional regulator
MPRAKHGPARRDAGRPRGEAVLSSVFVCTLAELAEHGPDNLSIERIAKAAQLNKTSIYRRWPTREALIAATLERVAEQLSLNVPETASLRGDLLALGAGIAAFVQSPAGMGLARAAMQDSAGSVIASMVQHRLERGTTTAAAAMIGRAVARGEWRPEIQPEPVLSMLVGAIFHQVMIAHQVPTTEWIATVVEVICSGVIPGKGPSTARGGSRPR